jgi:hypothetical protein
MIQDNFIQVANIPLISQIISGMPYNYCEIYLTIGKVAENKTL